MLVNKWHPLMVTIHWVVAILVIGALLWGILVLEEMPNEPAKLDPLRVHVIVGLSAGTLMVIRIFARLFTKTPPKVQAGNKVFNFLRSTVHFLFYVVVLSMVSTGLGIALLSGLFDILFGAGGALPESFDAFEPKTGHEFFAKVLIGLIVVHVLAALYHQFALKDGLIRRMWFRKHSA